MYTKTVIVSALVSLAAAAPAPRDISVFQAVSLRSGSPIQASSINASGKHFFVNKPGNPDCPSGVEGLDCTKYGNETLFSSSTATTGLSLAVDVPGGQQIYVESNGALGFTTPHSAAIPTGAVFTPFQYTPQESEGRVGNVQFAGSDFRACPVEGEANVYQIFAAAVSPETQVGCLGIDFGTAVVSSPPAWEFF